MNLLIPAALHDSRSPLPDPTKELRGEQSVPLSFKALAHFGERTAIETSQDSWTYRELDKATDVLAIRLRALLHQSDGAVCIVGARNAGLIISLIGTVRAGLAFTILDPSFPLQRSLRCLELVRPMCFITLGNNRDLDPRLITDIHARGVLLDLPQEKPDILERLAVDRIPPADGRDLRSAHSQKLLYITFTSGSTGFPKAVLGGHGPVTHFLSWQRKRFNLSAEDRFSMLSGLGHDPLLRDILAPLQAGACVCVPPPECFSVPHRMFEWILESKITICHLTPSLGTLLLAGVRREHRRLDSLRCAFFGGEPLKYALAQTFKSAAPNATIVNCYGATETPQVAAHYIVTEQELTNCGTAAERPQTVPVGHGIEGVQLLVQAADERLCGVREEGEIWVRSRYLAQDVWDEHDHSTATFSVNPHTRAAGDLAYPTGDFGYYLPDGAVVLTSRKDRQVKIRGHRLQIEEIERVLASTPGVLTYYVDSQADMCRDLSLAIYLVAEPNAAADPATVRAKLEANLPEYMIPERIFCVPVLPLTPNGKVDVDQLRRSAVLPDAVIGRAASPHDCGPLLDLCRQELNQSLGVDDNFRAKGLSSLTSVTLLCAIEARFGVLLSVEDLSECGTVRQLAHRISRFEVSASGVTNKSDVVPVSCVSEAAPVGTHRVPSSPAVRIPERAPGLLPKHESLLVGIKNRLLQVVARVAPDACRIRCHKWRGVTIGRNVSIGYDCVVETSYPWLVSIGDYVNIGMRVTIIGHFRDMASRDRHARTVEIDDYAFIGPGVIILPNVKIGRGSVVSAGSVVNTTIPPFVLAHGNPAVPIARCGVALSGDTTYDEFLRQLRPL